MATVSTVLVGDTAGPVGEAVSLLGAMAAQGLIRPFWHLAPSEATRARWSGTRFDRDGQHDVQLFSSIGAEAAAEVRLAALASPGDDDASGQVAEAADAVQRQLVALAPDRTLVRSARLWFPVWDPLSAPESPFFSPHVDANMVVVPEDRRSDHYFASPLSTGAAGLSGHVAAETAAILAMFPGMEGCVIEEMGPGVIFGDQPRIRLVRSFTRAGRSPALPLQEVVDLEGRLPVPPGTIEAPAPAAAVAELADRADPLFASLRFEARDPEPPGRRQLRPLRTLLLVLREMGRFIISLPRRAVEGLFEDFSELAGRMMQELVGSSSIVEVVWKGKVSAERVGEAEYDVLITDLKRQAERRLDLQGGPSIDQAVWQDLRAVVLSAADGSEPPPGVAPIEVRGQRAVVTDAAYLATHPEETLVDTARTILDESEGPSPRTLLGKLGQKVETIAGANRGAAARLLQSLDQQLTALTNYRPPGFAAWHIWGSILLAAFVVALLLLTGAIEAWGVTRMEPFTRDVLFGLLTISCASGIFVLGSYGRQAANETSRAGRPLDEGRTTPPVASTWLGALAGAVAGWLFVQFAVIFVGYPATTVAASAAVAAGLVSGAGIGQAHAFARYQEQLPPLGRLARLSILTVLVYVSIVFTGAVAQPGGWYADATPEQLQRLLWPVCGTLGVALLMVLAYVSWRRVQERLELRWYGQSIRSLAEQVDAAFTGDRVAEAAREQFLGLSAVLSRLIWFPYGRSAPLPAQVDGLADFGVSKASVRRFRLSARGEQLFEARTLRLASERGWLTSQYEKSIARFRDEEAVLLGTDDPNEVVRPDLDPMTVAQHEPEVRSDKGDRWRWADLFFAGAYDSEFLHALELHGEQEVFGPILAESANFEPMEGGREVPSLLEYMSEVLPVGDRQADPRYFDAEAMASGEFDRQWHHHVWWPREQLFGQMARTSDRSIRPEGSLAKGAVWLAARVDTTEDLEPGAIFGAVKVPEVPSVGAAGPDF